MRGSGVVLPPDANKLTRSLADLLGGARARKSSKASKAIPALPIRVDVVDAGLCNDVVRYLAPTLEQHKGCTVIDINPGACLFSSALHKFLQPRRHLLLEPEKKYFEPFIKPLLLASGSTYRYSSNVNSADLINNWSKKKGVFQDASLLPPISILPSAALKRRELDHGLLVVGNLARRHKVMGSPGTVVGHALKFLHEMGYGALSNGYFHTGGLVRMLLWVPELYKPATIPELPQHRTAFNVGLDMGLSISEVVGVRTSEQIRRERVTEGKRYLRSRPALLDATRNMEVSQRMHDEGIEVPHGRETMTLHADQSSVKDALVVSPLQTSMKSGTELLKTIGKVSSHLRSIALWVGKPASKRQAELEEYLKSLEYPQSIPTAQAYPQSSRYSEGQLAIFLDLVLRVINIEASFKNLEETSSNQTEVANLRNFVEALLKEFEHFREALPKRTQKSLEVLVGDQLLIFTPPPLVTRDRRHYEPLKAKTTDFFPPCDLMLLDMTPNSTDLSVPDLADSLECSRFCAELLKALFIAKSQPLPHLLDMIAVNASKDLIPMVPAITDIRKGGRWNPNHVKAYMVTNEMVEGLVKAFFEWPFRPRSWELALADRAGDEAEPEDATATA